MIPPPASREVISCPIYFELERRTSPARLSAKLERYCGHYLRVLREEGTCVLRPVLVVHHDPRSRPTMRHLPGSGAEALRLRVRQELTEPRRTAAYPAHFLALDEKLMQIDPSLDAGRLIVLADWRDIRSMDLSAPLYPVSSYPQTAFASSGDGSDWIWEVGIRELATEWNYTVQTIRGNLSKDSKNP